MHYEIARLYRTLIEDVIKSVLESNESVNIDLSIIQEIKTEWYNRITNKPVQKIIQEEEIVIDSDDNSDESIEPDCDNFLMCLYVKVTKSRNKWKCSFKDGFLNVGDLDFAFSTAHGELFW